MGSSDGSAGVKRVALWIGAAAFLCQLLAFSLIMPRLAGLPAPSSSLCLAHDGDAGAAPPSADHHDRGAVRDHGCPLCPLIGGLGEPPSPTGMPGAVDWTGRDDRALTGQRIGAGWFLARLQARGPPGEA